MEVSNKGLDIYRATVETKNGTRVNRFVEYELDNSELVQNRCIFIEFLLHILTNCDIINVI